MANDLIDETFDVPEEDMLAKSDRLYKQLREALGPSGLRSDWLCEYRKYLESHAIRAELHGWPSPEAFSQINIRNFIRQHSSSEGSENA